MVKNAYYTQPSIVQCIDQTLPKKKHPTYHPIPAHPDVFHT